ncbi:VOC family protein [Natrinema sp. 1APR25-10V2]|nr:VOC family protein [Natrinema sp. 1APR25-10V2]
MDQFTELLGLSFGDLMEPTTQTATGEQPVANRLSPSGIELVTPKSDDGQVAQFIERNGAGLYAVSLRVADLDAAVKELEQKDVEPVGRYESADFDEVFYHPKHFGGAFVILAEYDAPHPAETAAE